MSGELRSTAPRYQECMGVNSADLVPDGVTLAKKEKNMKLNIFCLGYVRGASAGCLAFDGYDVAGVDRVSTKVDPLQAYHP